MLQNIKKKSLALGLVVITLAGVNMVPASAHVTVNAHAETYYAGSGAALYIRVPHSKAGLNTVQVDVAMPANIGIVKPENIPGWTESVVNDTEGKNTISVTWKGGSLPDSSYADFGMKLTLPNTPGVTLYFPTVQTLNDGSTDAWVTIPVAGAAAPAAPAPSFVLNDKTKAVTIASLQAQIAALQELINSMQSNSGAGFVATNSEATKKISYMVASSYVNSRSDFTINLLDTVVNTSRQVAKGRTDGLGNIKGTFAGAANNVKVGSTLQFIIKGKVIFTTIVK